MKKKFKNLFILGAAKAGTTYLYNELIHHPQLIGADHPVRKRTKETRLLLKDDINKEDYIKAFSNNSIKNPKASILVDATPNYTSWPIHHVLPTVFDRVSDDFMCVYILRDPIDRFESHINFNEKRKFFLENNLLQILNSELGRHYINIGNYAMQLFGYKKIWENNRLLIIDFNELLNNTTKILGEIFEKLDLDINLLPKNRIPYKNTTPYYSIQNPAIISNPITRNLSGIFLSENNRKKLSSLYHKVIKVNRYPKRLLSDREKYKLAQIYKPSLINLKEEYGLNFHKTSWSTIKKYL